MPKDLIAQYNSPIMKMLETLKISLQKKAQLEALVKEEDRKIWKIITKIADAVEKKENLKSVSAKHVKKKQVSPIGRKNAGTKLKGS
jgi:glucosamine 6-phosphate synthetase-like amidotransferase/phosphosugar isomerase protein